jgi:hypothetical protein
LFTPLPYLINKPCGCLMVYLNSVPQHSQVIKNIHLIDLSHRPTLLKQHVIKLQQKLIRGNPFRFP